MDSDGVKGNPYCLSGGKSHLCSSTETVDIIAVKGAACNCRHCNKGGNTDEKESKKYQWRG